MRIVSYSFVMAALLPFVGGNAQEAVPVHREPRHRLVLDSTRFRVLDVQIPAGDTTRFHIHDTAILYVALLTAPTSAQPLGGDWPSTPASPPFSDIGEVRVDSSYIAQPVTHRVTNAGNSLFRLLAITSSGPTLATAKQESSSLPGAMELRSTWFHQSRVTITAQAMTEWLVSDRPVLVVQPHASSLALLYEGQARHPLDRAGSWVLVPPGVRYRIANDGRDSATAVAIAIR